MDTRKFNTDLSIMCRRAAAGRAPEAKDKLDKIKLYLVDLYSKNLVKINHSIIELLCARNLVEVGYEVEVEHRVAPDLVCDVFGTKGNGSIVVEIETGFVPPAHALDPATYCFARILSKTARYNVFANRFVLGTTVSNIISIPSIFLKPPRFREEAEVKKAKAVCDLYYKNPPILLEQILYAELHSVFILDVDNALIKETTPDNYLNEIMSLVRERRN